MAAPASFCSAAAASSACFVSAVTAFESTVGAGTFEYSLTPSAVAASSAMRAASTLATCESDPSLSNTPRSAELSTPVILRAEAITAAGVSGGAVLSLSNCIATVLHTAAETGTGHGGPCTTAAAAAAASGVAAGGGAAPSSKIPARGGAPLTAAGGAAGRAEAGATFGVDAAAGGCAGGAPDGDITGGATRALVLVCGRIGLRSANPGGGPAVGAARTAAVPPGGVGISSVGGGAEARAEPPGGVGAAGAGAEGA